MLKLAITGNIACGKSTIGEYLQKLGYGVIDSDATVHKILASPNEITEKLIKVTSPHSIVSNDENYYIDRSKLGKILFADASIKKQIEAILHPAVQIETFKFFEMQKSQKACMAANLIPLLFEIQAQSFFNLSWLIYCKPEIQKQRLKTRNPNLSHMEIEARLKAQMTQEAKKQLADYTIDNSDSLQYTYAQVDSALKDLCL